MDRNLAPHIDDLLLRALPDGGFSNKKGGDFRADATSWALLALRAADAGADYIPRSEERLAATQLSDGRVCVGQFAETFWATPLAILAWQESQACKLNRQQAADFLIKTQSVQVEKKSDSPFAHDTELMGWPWIFNSFAWVEPTALSMLALQQMGYREHERVQQGADLLMDRMLPRGGWNYGNTLVFDSELHPDMVSSGAALSALAGHIPSEALHRSLDYVLSEIDRIRTPLSLGWGLLGLQAWGIKPDGARDWVLECLDRQSRFIEYDTAQMGLLIFACPDFDGVARFLFQKESGDAV